MNRHDLEFARRTSVVRLLHALSETTLGLVLQKLDRRGHGDVGMAHATLLRNLDYNGTNLSVLASRAGVTKQAITRIARELHERGYVSIAPDPSDRRGKVVTFSRKGLQLTDAAVAVAREIEAEYAAVIGRTAVETLRRNLMRLTKELRARKSCAVGRR